ncbi:hypothetical protein ABPG75_004136 [Micractinium tetrahymenae]
MCKFTERKGPPLASGLECTTCDGLAEPATGWDRADDGLWTRRCTGAPRGGVAAVIETAALVRPGQPHEYPLLELHPGLVRQLEAELIAQGVQLVVVGHEDPRMGWCRWRLQLAQQATDDACALFRRLPTAAYIGDGLAHPMELSHQLLRSHGTFDKVLLITAGLNRL